MLQPRGGQHGKSKEEKEGKGMTGTIRGCRGRCGQAGQVEEGVQKEGEGWSRSTKAPKEGET